MITIENIYYSQEKIKSKSFDAYLPESKRGDTFIYFHGGGLVAGDKADAKAFACQLCDNNIALLSVNYRMYPDNKYPDFINDAAEAVAFITKNLHLYGDYKRVFVCGSSAGGYISMMLCFDKKYLLSHGVNTSDIYGYIHDAGQPTAHFNVLKERGFDERKIIVDDTCPLYHVGEEKALPKMLFIVSDNDMPNRFEQTQLMISTLKHFGFSENVSLKLMHGGHCEYLNKTVDGKNVFGEIVTEYILNN